MRITFVSLLLLGAMTNLAMQAQSTVPASHHGKLDIAATYDAFAANTVNANRFWSQGGSIQVDGRIWRGLGVVADVSGQHSANMHGSGVGLDLVTATFGPRYTWVPAKHKTSVFGQVLAGEANGFHSVFPSKSNPQDAASSLALQVGGGIDRTLSHRFLWRVFEADWQRTQLPNSTTSVQNNLRIGAGVVVSLY